jgi:PDZ domain-containing secreted protein
MIYENVLRSGEKITKINGVPVDSPEAAIDQINKQMKKEYKGETLERKGRKNSGDQSTPEL